LKRKRDEVLQSYNQTVLPPQPCQGCNHTSATDEDDQTVEEQYKAYGIVNRSNYIIPGMLDQLGESVTRSVAQSITAKEAAVEKAAAQSVPVRSIAPQKTASSIAINLDINDVQLGSRVNAEIEQAQERRTGLEIQNQQRQQEIIHQNMQSEKVMNLEENLYEAQQRKLWKLAAPQEIKRKDRIKQVEKQRAVRQKKLKALALKQERHRYKMAERDQEERYNLAVEQNWEQKHLGEIVSGDTGYNSIMTHKQAQNVVKRNQERRSKRVERLSHSSHTLAKPQSIKTSPTS